MKNTISDIVSARLKALGCDPIPAAVRTKVEADFEEATIKFAEETITAESFARTVKDVFAPRRKMAPSLQVPPLLPEKRSGE